METTQNIILVKTIEQAKRGNAKALHLLYQQYSKAMFNVCMRMTNSREDAEDILQEAFTDAFQNLSSFSNEATFGVWLKRIVVNRCINKLKKKQIELVFTDEQDDSIDDDTVDYTNVELQIEKVRRAVETLPEGYRLVCSLYLFEGYDHTEIAQILTISESTSKSQYLRAKMKLKEIMANDEK